MTQTNRLVSLLKNLLNDKFLEVYIPYVISFICLILLLFIFTNTKIFTMDSKKFHKKRKKQKRRKNKRRQNKRRKNKRKQTKRKHGYVKDKKEDNKKVDKENDKSFHLYETSITEEDNIIQTLSSSVDDFENEIFKTPKEYISNHCSIGEERCRQIFEKIFECKFPTVRPQFLKNPKTNRNLELDGYNHKLKIAFEYNGYQHYDYPNVFHKTRDEFYNQRERDTLKKELCKKYKVKLITIPYKIKKENIETYIKEKLKKYNLI